MVCCFSSTNLLGDKSVYTGVESHLCNFRLVLKQDNKLVPDVGKTEYFPFSPLFLILCCWFGGVLFGWLVLLPRILGVFSLLQIKLAF